MKPLFLTVFVIAIAILSSCDLRSGTAKEEMEKFSGTPTPTISPIPTPSPIDPADSVAVDTNLEGDMLTVDGHGLTKSLNCNKYDQVLINGNGNTATIKGVCRQIMINGDENVIKVDASVEFVFNGTGNSLKYMRYANGKRPLVAENKPGNIIEKIAFEPEKSGRSREKDEK